MNRLWLVAALWACGGDDGRDPASDAHTAATCSGWTLDGAATCELACAQARANTSQQGCSASNPKAGSPLSCPGTLDFEGLTGCCIPVTLQSNPNKYDVRFYECD